MSKKLTENQLRVLRRLRDYGAAARFGTTADFIGGAFENKQKRGRVRAAVNVLGSLVKRGLVSSWWPHPEDSREPMHYRLTGVGAGELTRIDDRPCRVAQGRLGDERWRVDVEFQLELPCEARWVLRLGQRVVCIRSARAPWPQRADEVRRYVDDAESRRREIDQRLQRVARERGA